MLILFGFLWIDWSGCG